MIGLSVSRCIGEILDGKVSEDDVEEIIGSTAAANEDDWETVIARYRQIPPWQKEPDEGEAILRRFLAAGKIKQPRLEGEEFPNAVEVIWK